MKSTETGPNFKGYQTPALVLGVIGLILLAVGFFLDPIALFPAYLVGYIFWLQIALGCMVITMIWNLTGGGWGYVTQRLLRAGMLTLPVWAVLFVPMLLGLPVLYEWARPEVVAQDELLQHKLPYLNVPFFVGRAVLYFVIWIGLALLLDRWSKPLDQQPENMKLARRLRSLSGLGLGVFGLSITFAAIDWMMSLEPHWFSTIYGIMFGVGAIAAAYAFVAVALAWLVKGRPFAGTVTTLNVNDLGNFLLAGVMLWAYIALSQYLIIWSGNVAEATPWYFRRTNGGWEVVGLVLTGLHFVLPFLVLLSRSIKRSIRLLVNVAALVVVMRVVDLYWLIIPAFHEQFYLDWLIIVAPIGLGGLWLAAFFWNLQQTSLLPGYGVPQEEKHHPHGTRKASTHP